MLSRVEEKQLELDQIDEQTKKAEADLAIRNNQDQVELLRARYAVRRAELEVKRNALLGEIDQKKQSVEPSRKPSAASSSSKATSSPATNRPRPNSAC